mmetsp:Transcript_15713/g.28113  ORF Transcript_15713/g.28113 Transcript_15713/m.28113 type:complete len:720 (-) Transcript_15713:811-2970(-)
MIKLYKYLSTVLFCFTILLKVNISVSVQYTSIHRPCAEGCTKKGNCNIEEGRCECPYGFAGPTCEVGLLSACQAKPDTSPFVGFFVPKSCRCLEQLVAFYYCNENACSSDIYFTAGENARCFKYKNGTDFEYSDLPEKSDPSVEYFRRFGFKSGRYESIDVEKAYIGNHAYYQKAQIKPFHYCPRNCSYRGICVNLDRENRIACRCVQGYEGHSCDIASMSFCANRCSGRGTCDRGFCHCTPPYFGIDCSRSKAYGILGLNPNHPVADDKTDEDPNTVSIGGRPEKEGDQNSKNNISNSKVTAGMTNGTANAVVAHQSSEKISEKYRSLNPLDYLNYKAGIFRDLWPTSGQIVPYSPPRNKIRIYMYELPSHVAFNAPSSDILVDRPLNYMAYEMFKDAFLNDWAIRTENPYEANLFYIPASIYAYISNTPNDAFEIRVAVDYVRMNYPFFNRTQGRDHFIWYPPDRGACYLNNATEIRNVMKIVHFGLYFNTWEQKPENIIYGQITDALHGCFDPLKDIAAASAIHVDAAQSKASFDEIQAKAGHVDRNLFLFFAGSMRHNQLLYSGGIRQMVHKLIREKYKDDPTILIKEGGVADYIRTLRNSTFCFSPYGAGYGVRFYQAVLYGCIPVIIQDHVVQPYSEFLPYYKFSVTMHKSEIPMMVEHLRSYTAADIAEMRMNLLKYHRAFFWQKELRGEAFAYTIRALMRQIGNYWGNVGH